MGCQGIPLVTKGMIFCPKIITNEIIKDCAIPFTVKFNKDDIKLTLNRQSNFQLPVQINIKKLSLTKSTKNITQNLIKRFTLNLKKCEE